VVDLPVSVDRVDRRAIADGQLQVNLSESLITVPVCRCKAGKNYAQDLQLSVRGSVRGRVLVSAAFALFRRYSRHHAGRSGPVFAIRLRIGRPHRSPAGPFSALYGNSSGGVIAIFTEDAKRVICSTARPSTAPSTLNATP